MHSPDDQPLRVLMICPQFHPLVGGYERAAERLSAALADAGMRVDVITERRDSTWPKMECIDGYEVRRLPCWYRRHFHTVTSVLSFADFLSRHGRDFDVWHVHQYGYHAALAVALGKVLHRPVVLKLPSSNVMGIEKAMGTGIVKHILRFFHSRVSACLAVSEETCAEAVRFGISADRVYLSPNGLNGREFRPASPEDRYAARRVLGLVCDRLVLNVGRLSAEKNPLGLLDAWAAVDPKARAGALLALIGDGPERAKVEAKAQALNLAGSVHLTGHCSEVATWYRAADLYVISSHIEGLSNSMIEAMASGLPLVSTRVSGSSILTEEPLAGLVVNVGNVKEIAAAIEGLLADESIRLRLSKNARLKFESHFSMETVVRQITSLYEGLRFQQQES